MRLSRSSWVLLAAVVLLVNFPLVHATWTRSSVERSGVDVRAEVTETRNLGTEADPSWWLSYRLPRDLDPGRRSWSSQVDASTYDRAETEGTVEVRVIAGEPASAIVDGEVRSRAGLVGTLVADLVLGALLLFLWRVRGPGRREVQTVEALEDVRPGAGAAWEDLGDGTALVTGEVLESDVHEVLLDAGDRLVRVVLDGHTGPTDQQQPAQVRVRQSG